MIFYAYTERSQSSAGCLGSRKTRGLRHYNTLRCVVLSRADKLVEIALYPFAVGSLVSLPCYIARRTVFAQYKHSPATRLIALRLALNVTLLLRVELRSHVAHPHTHLDVVKSWWLC